MLVKVSTIPKGTRSQSWMGWTNLHDYTVQADFYARRCCRQATGHGFDQSAIHDRLDGQRPVADSIVDVAIGAAICEDHSIPLGGQPMVHNQISVREQRQGVTTRGKVWKRGEEEPKEWTIEATDATPNKIGSLVSGAVLAWWSTISITCRFTATSKVAVNHLFPDQNPKLKTQRITLQR